MTTETIGRAGAESPISLAGIELPRGVRLRRWRGLDADLPAMWAVADAVKVADGEVDRQSYDGMATYYRHLERSDPSRDLVIGELDGRVVAYARVMWNDSNDGERWYEAVCNIHPDVRRRGLGRPLLTWTERRRLEIAMEHATAGEIGDRPTWLTSFLWDGDVGGRVLLTSAGYEPFRRFASMRRPDLDAIQRHPLPEGLEIRPIRRDEPLMRRVFDADVEAFLDHFGTSEGGGERFAEFLEDPDLDPELWVVAFDGEEIAGAVLNGIHAVPGAGRQGWLDSVFVRRPWRRRGLARALITASLELLRSRGLTSAWLGVDLSNPNQALALYESCGFVAVSGATAFRKPLPAAIDGGSMEEPG